MPAQSPDRPACTNPEDHWQPAPSAENIPTICARISSWLFVVLTRDIIPRNERKRRDTVKAEKAHKTQKPFIYRVFMGFKVVGPLGLEPRTKRL